MPDDPRNFNHGEIVSFVEKTNEAESPERLTGFFTRSQYGAVGIRTADNTWIDFDHVHDVRRVPVIQDPMKFVADVVRKAAKLSGVGLGDANRQAIANAVGAEITNLFQIPPEPPQWTTVKVTYANPEPDSNGWDYYFRDIEGPDFDPNGLDPHAPRWMGPSKYASWASLQEMGRVEIMPTPKNEED